MSHQDYLTWLLVIIDKLRLFFDPACTHLVCIAALNHDTGNGVPQLLVPPPDIIAEANAIPGIGLEFLAARRRNKNRFAKAQDDELDEALRHRTAKERSRKTQLHRQKADMLTMMRDQLLQELSGGGNSHSVEAETDAAVHADSDDSDEPAEATMRGQIRNAVAKMRDELEAAQADHAERETRRIEQMKKDLEDDSEAIQRLILEHHLSKCKSTIRQAEACAAWFSERYREHDTLDLAMDIGNYDLAYCGLTSFDPHLLQMFTIMFVFLERHRLGSRKRPRSASCSSSGGGSSLCTNEEEGDATNAAVISGDARGA